MSVMAIYQQPWLSVTQSSWLFLLEPDERYSFQPFGFAHILPA
jgi:hypothetical protein